MRGIEYLFLTTSILLLTVVIISLLVGRTRTAGAQLNLGLVEYEKTVGISSVEEMGGKKTEEFSLLFYCMASLWAGTMLWFANRIWQAVR